jgi:predicted RNA-binding Zn-ribbon protein involved in translation (DUF1610 family)
MIAKTSCQHCGIHIEFDAENVNQLAPCPSCGNQTRLSISNQNTLGPKTQINQDKQRLECTTNQKPAEFRCKCFACDKSISFEAFDFVFSSKSDGKIWGQVISCPHCKQNTRIYKQSNMGEVVPSDGESLVVDALNIFAFIEFIGAVTGGLVVGINQSPFLGVCVFAGGVFSGFVLLGFAAVVENTKATSQRLARIERILRKDRVD